MAFVPAWQQKAGGGCWPIAAPKAALGLAPETSVMVPPRLKCRAEFQRVAAFGHKLARPGFVLQVLPRADPGPARLGFTTTRRIGNAVTRNRARRRLREAAWLTLTTHPVIGADIVLVGRNATATIPFTTLLADFERALTEAGL